VLDLELFTHAHRDVAGDDLNGGRDDRPPGRHWPSNRNERRDGWRLAEALLPPLLPSTGACHRAPAPSRCFASRPPVARVAHSAGALKHVGRRWDTYHLPPLSRGETAQYIAHLLRRAGTELPLFEPAAVEAIFQATGALPRRINGLAHHTLLAAAVAKAKIATADHVQVAIPEVA
jgi:hypothetical protein